MEWLSYTYLVLRMKRNPLQYGMSIADVEDDPQLAVRRYARPSIPGNGRPGRLAFTHRDCVQWTRARRRLRGPGGSSLKSLLGSWTKPA